MKFEIVNFTPPQEEIAKVHLENHNGHIKLIVNGIEILYLTINGDIHRSYISLTEAASIPFIKVNVDGRIVTNFDGGDKI